MPISFSNPDGVHRPGSRYSHVTAVEGGGRWLVISGQVGLTPEERLIDPAWVILIYAA